MYNKLLIAKHDPKNKCFAKEMEVLSIIPKKPHPQKDGKYHFIGSQSREKSQYGWVVDVEPFSLNDFMEKYAIDPSGHSERDYIKTMLDSAQKYKPETPIAANFALRGVMQKHVVLTIHKVVFY